MSDLLERSARIVDTGTLDPGFNPMTGNLHVLADGVAMVDAFSHVVAFATDDGLVLFDVSHAMFGPRVVEALRSWSSDRIAALVYTHGHLDHVGGAAAILADNEGRGPRPQVIGHERVAERFDRYALTAGYNATINARQFGGSAITRTPAGKLTAEARDLAESWLAGLGVRPSTTYRTELTVEVGGTTFELHHARGETDDHTWAFEPSRRAAIVGDFVTWVFPNAGNPQKVQRFALEWAGALRAIAATEPELLLPAHGLPLSGRDRIALVLGDGAAALEQLTRDTLELMNAGATLDEVLGTVRLDPDLAERPWLAPLYDKPAFVVHNIWRLYGGWYDGNPAHLEPAREAAVAAELAALAGGASVLTARALELAASEELALACHLIELAVAADPSDRDAHLARVEIYSRRRSAELSLMGKGIYGDAARRSAANAEALAAEPEDADAPGAAR